jgi:general secretion pathway protein H
VSPAAKGMTLIEITVALAVAGVLFGTVVLSVGSLTGARAKEATTELAGTVRSLYDTAALTGKTCRLVFELPAEKDDDGAVKYRAECGAAGLTTAKNRDEALREAEREQKDKDKQKGSRSEERFKSFSADDAPSVQELMAREKQRVDDAAKYSSYTSEEVPERALPSSVRLSVWTRHQQRAVSSGVAYLYFFPQGYTERAQVAVRQGKNVWTLLVSPLTGKVSVVADEVEVPRS